MSSYERVNWKNSPIKKTAINDANLNKMDEGIEAAHNGENIPNFESFDDAESYETIMDVETISAGEKLSTILSKITKFTNNIRYIINALDLETMHEAGYSKVGDAIAKLSDKLDNIAISNYVFTRTISANSAVTPYSYAEFFYLDEEIINTHGKVISACATGGAGAPTLCSFYEEENGTYFRVVSNSATVTIYLTCMKFGNDIEGEES